MIQRVPLVTSIPPSTKRVDPSGVEVGAAYLRACMDSWIAQSFDPITVNSKHESMSAVDLTGMRRVAVERDAKDEVGKPLVYFQDLIAAGLSTGADVVALTNSDVLLDPGFDLPELLSQLRPGRAIFSRRIDVPTLGERQGSEYEHGFDFFAVHRLDLEKVRDTGLVFGAPWWDYMMPCALIAQGVEPLLLKSPFAFHMLHEERWKPVQWHAMATHFLNGVPALLRPSSEVPMARDLAARIDHALVDPPEPATVTVTRALRRVLKRGYVSRRTVRLHRVSTAINRFFDECCSATLAEAQRALR